jgi:hypothetical protein
MTALAALASLLGAVACSSSDSTQLPDGGDATSHKDAPGADVKHVSSSDGGHDAGHKADAGHDSGGKADSGHDSGSAADTGVDGTGRDSGVKPDASDAGRPHDAGSDVTKQDAGKTDGGRHDALTSDAAKDAKPPPDAGKSDAKERDAAKGDAKPHDASTDVARDGARDGAADASDAAPDTGHPGATTLTTSLGINPVFSTSATDYYVTCPGSANAITVTMTAAPGSTIQLIQPMMTAPTVAASIMVNVAVNGLIEAQVTDEGSTQQYYIRCLPSNFPQYSVQAHSDAGTPTPGYYLIGNILDTAEGGGYAMALNAAGVPLWYHVTKTGLGAINVQNLAPGTISFVPYLEESTGLVTGQVELHDLLTATTTYVAPSGTPLDMHEFQIDPSTGLYMVISDVVKTGINLTGLQSYGSDEDMIDCLITEFDGSGNVTWSWDAYDHFDPVKVSTFPTDDFVGTGNAVNPFHCNALDIQANGDVLVSGRAMDSVFYISRATGDVVWKMGGPQFSLDPGTVFLDITGDPQGGPHRQHDARMQPGGASFSVFDDETGLSGPARAVVYDFDVTTASATMQWQYVGTTTSDDMGSFRISADGSRVIGWGYTGGDHPAFTEISTAGEDILDFTFVDSNTTYRAVKVPTSAFDITLLRATAGTD